MDRFNTVTHAFRPVDVRNAELSSADALERIGDMARASGAPSLLLMLTMCGEPIGAVRIDTARVAADPSSVLAAAERDIDGAAARHGHRPVETPATCAWTSEYERLTDDPEAISVVICTAGRPDRLRATLQSLSEMNYPEFELVLVDNAPTGDANHRVLEEYADRIDAQYVVAPIRGLSRARNVGLRTARHDLIAYTDDDVLLRPEWLRAVLAAFRREAGIGLVTGPVLPAEIVTPAQETFERQGGLTKGRGFTRATFTATQQSPYFPLPPFAIGCNMTFRRSILEQLGGFDEALGAGTPAQAGEDTAAVAEVMLGGWAVAFEPAAVMWHFHRRSPEDLSIQRRNYGIGLGAFYASLVRRDRRRVWPLVRLAPKALAALAGRPRTAEDKNASTDHVSSVVTRRYIAQGPYAYLRGRREL